MKFIFSYITKKKKFELISYNKKIQNKFKINIEDYKKESGKYIIIGENCKGIEYDLYTDKKIFEGEYLNNKKNGYGIEFYENGQKKFEGVYKNGYKIYGKGFDINNNEILKIEKDGKGKEYYDNKQIQFKGEYINGKRWNGIGYNYKGKKKFEIKHGKGFGIIFDFKGKLNFKGTYFNGEKNELGFEYDENELLIFEGYYTNGKKKNGKEFNKEKNVVYEGEYLNNKRGGIGKEYYFNGQVLFEGEYCIS